DGAGVLIHCTPQGRDVVLWNEVHIVEKWLKTFAVLVLAGQRHGAECSPVIRTFQRDQFTLALPSRAVAGKPGQFDRAFDGFGPAVGKENLLHSGKQAKSFSESALVFVVVEVREMNDFGGLLTNHFHDGRMRMPERVYSQPGHKIQVLLAINVVQKNPFPPGEHDRISVVGREQEVLFTLDDLFCGCHGGLHSRASTCGPEFSWTVRLKLGPCASRRDKNHITFSQLPCWLA